MSKPSHAQPAAAPARATATLPAETAAALEGARAALSERARLAAMRATLTADLAAAGARRDAAAQDVKAAELDAVLSGDPPKADLMAIAADARRAHSLAIDAVTRLEDAIEALPARLAQADEALSVASTRLAPLLTEARQAGLAEFQREVVAAAAPLVALAARWRARTAGLGIASPFLTELRVPGVTTAAPILSGRAALAFDGTTINLDDIWRADPDAVATFQAGNALNSTAAALDRHEIRIRTERQNAEIEARNNRPAERQVWNFPPAPAPMPPGPRFVPNSWSSTQHFAPPQIPADRVLTGAPPAAPVAREIGQPFQTAAGIRGLGGAGEAGSTATITPDGG